MRAAALTVTMLFAANATPTDMALAARADLVVTGSCIAIGFQHVGQSGVAMSAWVHVDSVQKGRPPRDLHVLITDPKRCAGGHPQMYLKLLNGTYVFVDDAQGIRELH